MSEMFSGKHDEDEPCDGCGKRPSVSMGHGSYKCEACFKAMFCPKCRYTLTKGHVCPSPEEHAERQRVNGYFMRDMDGTESYNDACLRLDEEVSELKAQLAVAVEALSAANDALYDAARGAPLTCARLACEMATSTLAKLRAAKEKR